jgi:hypothetical protein
MGNGTFRASHNIWFPEEGKPFYDEQAKSSIAPGLQIVIHSGSIINIQFR